MIDQVNTSAPGLSNRELELPARSKTQSGTSQFRERSANPRESDARATAEATCRHASCSALDSHRSSAPRAYGDGE